MKISLYTYFTFLIFLLSCRHSSDPLDASDVRHAQRLIGIQFSTDKIDTLLPYLRKNLSGYDSMRHLPIDPETKPALFFNPLPSGFVLPQGEDDVKIGTSSGLSLPLSDDSLCFFPVSRLASLIRSKRVSSVQLTHLYLERIKRYDPSLRSFITLTEDLALQQAQKADHEISQGLYRGPLHGIPYGLKDLIAVEGYPTTWGAIPYRNQMIGYTATIARKLEESGAVLLGKLSSGALARGDVWFDGQTVCPWDTLIGSGGSSAGSAAALSAGLVAFAIGTETLGSIMSPSGRNGVTGLRPSYGTVSRHGVMTLTWSMDKIGPICRDAQDCALVFQAIHGHDPSDPGTFQTPVRFDHRRRLQDFRVGILTSAIETDTTSGAQNINRVKRLLDSLHIPLIDKNLPDKLPFAAFDIISRSESAAFFDDLIRSPAIDDLAQQDRPSRANALRQARFIPAVEYLQANRYRTVLIDQMHAIMQDIDVLISPPAAENQVLITNLTGIPALSLPTGLDSLGLPTSMTVIADLFNEGILLEFGNAFQQQTHYHHLIPPLFKP